MSELNDWTKSVGEIAHEIKAPLTSAMGNVDLLQNGKDPLTDKQRRFVDKTMEALERMERLVALLLEVSWIDAERPLNLQSCEPGVLIERVVESLHDYAERHRVELSTEIDPELGSVQADEQRFDEVLVNLIGNAIKYNHPDGKVRIRAQGYLDHVEVFVIDTGRGIAPESLPRIFERFFREEHSGAKVEGTGLGLAIVEALVKKHGGRIWVESTLGTGSTFAFMLPRDQAPREGREAQREANTVLAEPRDPVDLAGEDDTKEELDAVDDNIQEPPQTLIDEDENEAAV